MPEPVPPLSDQQIALVKRYATVMIDDERVASYLLRLLAEHAALKAEPRDHPLLAERHKNLLASCEQMETQLDLLRDIANEARAAYGKGQSAVGQRLRDALERLDDYDKEHPGAYEQYR